MKYLVLALCVCAASAASFGSYGAYKPYQYTPVVPPRVAAQAVAQVTGPVLIPAVKAAPVPVVPKSYNTEADAQIVRALSEVRPDGFSYSYETNNGIAAESSGAVKRVGDLDVLAVQGGYRYVSPDGTPVVFTYVADENGYQPQSDLLPVAPPVPEAILRSLRYNAEHPQPVEYVKKF